MLTLADAATLTAPLFAADALLFSADAAACSFRQEDFLSDAFFSSPLSSSMPADFAMLPGFDIRQLMLLS